MEEDRLSLFNMYLGGPDTPGGVVEQFDIELQKAIANISDINTVMGKRKVVLEVELAPADENRTMIACTAKVKPATLAGIEPVKFLADVKLSGDGRHYAVERNPKKNQPDLPFGEGKVRHFPKTGD